MEFLKFLGTRLFLRHLGIAISLALLILIITLLILRIYTHHGQQITVPDLSGLSLEEVEDVISSRQLRYEVIDSVYSSALPRGTVLKQNPSPNSQVKKNRKVFLTMNAIHPESVRMPQLVGLSFRQARLALQNAGLVQGEITYRPDYAKNNVLQQMYADSVINEGTEIIKGAVIDLVLGMGLSSQTTRVPNLIGLSLEEASQILADFYLNTGAVTYDQSLEEAKDSSGAFIWRQYPEYDEYRRLNMGMELDLWLTLDSTRLPVPGTPEGDDIE